MQRIEQHACFGGSQEVWQHRSEVLGCDMRFAVYLPPQVAQGGTLPVLYWLSGLTCTEQNFITKAGAQRYAAEHGVILVAPDTSPRGDDVADAEGYDLGKGAGFYVDATQAPWAANYRMHDYVANELPALVEAQFPVTDARAISGHSISLNCRMPLRSSERISRPRERAMASSGGASVATAKGKASRAFAITTTRGATAPGASPRLRTSRNAPSDSVTAGTAR